VVAVVDMVDVLLLHQLELMVVAVVEVEVVHQVSQVEQEILPLQILLKDKMEDQVILKQILKEVVVAVQEL
tara:strand:+ start:373 stop:585 length:213 start_codon:yes stop_codon:yes gene_type:complete